jgi:uncharacterized YccA/Bax inhibitor family protein
LATIFSRNNFVISGGKVAQSFPPFPYAEVMSNPVLNDTTFDRLRERHAGESGWGMPTSSAPASSANASGTWAPPMTDGPVTKYHGGVMTAGGTSTAGLVLFALLLVAAVVGWMSVSEPQPGALQVPAWPLIAAVGGFILALVMSFKPLTARFLAPVYALAQGAFLGAISRVFDAQYSGIVLQAVGITLGVFLVMLTLYRTRVLRVTNRYRRIVVGATLGVMVFYLASFVIGFFGVNISFINSGSGLGILFSLFVAGLAAANLALDFEFIERGEQEGLPRAMEWFAAFGLLVTIVWLYLEVLRLLAKLRDR